MLCWPRLPRRPLPRAWRRPPGAGVAVLAQLRRKAGGAGSWGAVPSSHPPRKPLLMRYRMSQGDSNPAAIPHAAEDIQGDDRWMSQVIVVWVGTNNHENTAEEVAGGIEAIVQLINTRQPQAKIIVLGLLPRGEKPNPLRQKNAKVNQLLKVSLPKLANVQLLDTDGGFVHSDGAISCHDMFDFLHLTGGGYAKICKPLHELIMQLLEETPEEKQTTIA
ncbi:platelet-activating factor acetylhydrolase IB subunit beta isoform X5 [Myotis myotis]|nr:platelet-activating factor acetylhydrolase IB subunit beta isoform X5 [Myotis myotis]